jgi:hypothetical protein
MTNNVGLRLVLVTLNMLFTISIEQDKIELVTLNTVFSLVYWKRWVLQTHKLAHDV